MNYAVMPLSDYKAACDKVREKVDLTTVRFEDTDFGYIRSAVFTAKESGEYIFTVEVKDESKLNIYGIYYAVPEWEDNSSPGMFNVIDEKTLSVSFIKGETVRIFISDYDGLKASDIVFATLSHNGEVVENFVEPPKIKSGELADKVEEVYWTAASDFGLKGKGQGELVHFENVHPIEHKVAVGLSSKNLYVADFSDCKVYARGKNLLNLEGREVVNFGTGGSTTKRTFFNEKAIILGLAVNNAVTPVDYDFEITENTISCTQKQASYGMGLDVKLLPNTTYRFSCSERTPGSSIRLIEYDAEGNYIKNTTIVSNSVTTSAKATWGVFMFKADTANYEHYISNPQLEYGSTITEYEPPIPETEYTANADGTVENVKSISPTMNLRADKAGAVIDAECFLDPQAVLTSLTNTVITLGGEV